MILAALLDLAFVTAQNGGVLQVVALPSGEVRAELPLDGKPAPVACRPGGGAVVVEPEARGRVRLVSAEGRIAGERVLGSAFGVAVAPDGAIFVTDWDGRALRRLGPDLADVWSVPTGAAPTGVDTDGQVVAVAERDDDTVALFDAGTGAFRGRIAVGAHPFGVTLHGGEVWTADVESATVSVATLDPPRLTATIEVGARPYAIAFAGGVAAVTNQGDGTVSLIEGGAVVAEVATGEAPEGIAATSDGRFAVAHWFDNTLVLLDPATRAVDATFPTADGPRAFGRFVCPD